MRMMMVRIKHWRQFPPKLGRVHDKLFIPLLPSPPLPSIPSLPLPHPLLTRVLGFYRGKMFDFTDAHR